jgi:hypothetical protein
MTKEDKLKNIISFLCIVFGEDILMTQSLMNKSPEYLIEKWERYCESNRAEHEWGMHPTLRARVFEKYLSQWDIA